MGPTISPDVLAIADTIEPFDSDLLPNFVQTEDPQMKEQMGVAWGMYVRHNPMLCTRSGAAFQQALSSASSTINQDLNWLNTVNRITNTDGTLNEREAEQVNIPCWAHLPFEIKCNIYSLIGDIKDLLGSLGASKELRYIALETIKRQPALLKQLSNIESRHKNEFLKAISLVREEINANDKTHPTLANTIGIRYIMHDALRGNPRLNYNDFIEVIKDPSYTYPVTLHSKDFAATIAGLESSTFARQLIIDGSREFGLIIFGLVTLSLLFTSMLTKTILQPSVPTSEVFPSLYAASFISGALCLLGLRACDSTEKKLALIAAEIGAGRIEYAPLARKWGIDLPKAK